MFSSLHGTGLASLERIAHASWNDVVLVPDVFVSDARQSSRNAIRKPKTLPNDSALPTL